MLYGFDFAMPATSNESLVTAWHMVDEDGRAVRLDAKMILASWIADRTNP